MVLGGASPHAETAPRGDALPGPGSSCPLCPQALYGDATLGTTGSLLNNPARNALLFNPGCLAAEPGLPCSDVTHPWHAKTAFGLDNAVNFFMEEAAYLVEAPQVCASAGGTAAHGFGRLGALRLGLAPGERRAP